jgi:hypothetical protein
MPIYTVEIDGHQYDIEGDHPPTEADARAAVGAVSPKQQAAPEPAKQPGILDSPIVQRFLHGDKEINGVPINAPGLGLADAATPYGINPLSVAKKVPGILARGLGMSMERGGQNIESALQAARETPVVTDEISSLVQRAKELATRGNRPTRAVNQLAARIGDAENPILAPEAHDFASSFSRMSPNEFGNLSGPMRRQVSQISKALREATTTAAGDGYASGVKEYGRGASAAKVVKAVKSTALPQVAKGAAQATGVGGLYGLARALGWFDE